MTTFNKISVLLDEQQRNAETQRLMLSGGMATRTQAGNSFFINNLNRFNSTMEALSEYPWEWIEAVKVVSAIRTRNDVVGRAINI